jgi:hypothetical protein
MMPRSVKCLATTSEDQQLSTVVFYVENRKVWADVRKPGLKINLPKYFVGAVAGSYLGSRLTPQGITPVTDKLKAVIDAKPPNDVYEVRQFLGLCNFFRGHVQSFAQITVPLNALTRKDCP